MKEEQVRSSQLKGPNSVALDDDKMKTQPSTMLSIFSLMHAHWTLLVIMVDLGLLLSAQPEH